MDTVLVFASDRKKHEAYAILVDNKRCVFSDDLQVALWGACYAGMKLYRRRATATTAGSPSIYELISDLDTEFDGNCTALAARAPTMQPKYM
jgi:hypothetical protein